MKTVAIVVSAALLAGTLSVAVAQQASPSDGYKAFTPQEIKWSAAPPTLPKGAEMSVLYGDPTKEGPFVLRLKMPSNYLVPPHTHPVLGLITVISGTYNLGMGEKADKSKAQALPAGSFFSLSPNMPHFGYTDEGTIIQISTVGPWGLSYLNPQDAPQQQ